MSITAIAPEAASLQARGLRIVASYAHAGGFSPICPPSDELSRLRLDSRQWIADVGVSITAQNAGGIQALLLNYDMVHRIAYGIPSPDSFMDKWHGAVLAMMAKGEKADKVQLMGWMRSRLSESPRRLSAEQRLWYGAVISRWIGECRGPRPLSSHTEDEAVRIARFLLEANLRPFTPDQDSVKARLRTRFMVPGQ